MTNCPVASRFFTAVVVGFMGFSASPPDTPHRPPSSFPRKRYGMHTSQSALSPSSFPRKREASISAENLDSGSPLRSGRNDGYSFGSGAHPDLCECRSAKAGTQIWPPALRSAATGVTTNEGDHHCFTLIHASFFTSQSCAMNFEKSAESSTKRQRK